ncbi:hypothetical protein [Diaphorobacter sp.]|uniref:hypothetical protein n=1 Tax=Diaphorobacter sp. TaxID=1934310 RepID=UPI0028AF1E6E|nr:hypothetical protein [Diaphorobacter sp.]
MAIHKKLGLALAVAGLAAALSGCSNAPIPLAKNFELTSEYKVRSAGHWEILSRDIVSQTRDGLARAGYRADTPVYVSMPANASTFDLAFRDFLITHLVQDGAKVYDRPGQGLEVTYNAQLVRHNSDRPHFIPGQFTMLAGGVMAAYGLRHAHLDTQLLAVLGLAGAADYANSINSGGPTNTEMVLTTTVSNAGQYVSRKTDVYYLENADTPLFLRPSYYRAVNMNVVAQ